MTNTMQHHSVTLIPHENKVNETRELLLQCARQIASKKHENGPISWSASFDENKKHFFVDALFPNQESVIFHQNNIKSIVKNFSTLMAVPSETIIKGVFTIAEC
jgi:hypothetical protein